MNLSTLQPLTCSTTFWCCCYCYRGWWNKPHALHCPLTAFAHTLGASTLRTIGSFLHFEPQLDGPLLTEAVLDSPCPRALFSTSEFCLFFTVLTTVSNYFICWFKMGLSSQLHCQPFQLGVVLLMFILSSPVVAMSKGLAHWRCTIHSHLSQCTEECCPGCQRSVQFFHHCITLNTLNN